MDEQTRKKELRKKLRERIDEKKIVRSTKENKEKILEDTLSTMNIDKERLKYELEILKKSGMNYTL